MISLALCLQSFGGVYATYNFQLSCFETAMLIFGLQRANTNTWRLCFWMLAHILHNPTIQSQINEEVLAANILDLPTSMHPSVLSRCQLLVATYHESLRLVNSVMSVRHVRRPIRTASQKLLQPGSRVIIALSDMMQDETVFGENLRAFQPERFIRNEALAKSRSFAPFGGGSKLCPGRFLAKRQVLAFVGIAMSRFEMSALPGQEFPRLDLKKGAGLGTLGPVAGDDVLTKMSLRVVK